MGHTLIIFHANQSWAWAVCFPSACHNVRLTSMRHLQPMGGVPFSSFLVIVNRKADTGRWVSSHLIQQNEIIQPVVKIINESHIGYMSVSLGKQVVLVFTHSVLGEIEKLYFLLVRVDSLGVGWLLFWFSPGHTTKHFIFHKQSLIALMPICYKAHRAEIDFYFLIQFLTKIRQSLHVLFLRRDWMEATLCVRVR